MWKFPSLLEVCSVVRKCTVLVIKCKEERKNLKSVSLKLLTINKGKKHL